MVKVDAAGRGDVRERRTFLSIGVEPSVRKAGSIGRKVDKKKTGRNAELRPVPVLAEWTGLEPATPGVTGRCTK